MGTLNELFLKFNLSEKHINAAVSHLRHPSEAKQIHRNCLPHALRKFMARQPPPLTAALTVAWERRSLTNRRGLQTWPQRLLHLVVWVCWGVSWPHHSRQSHQRLWHSGGIIKALGGRSQQPDVTLRFPSSTGWGKDTGLRQKRSDPLQRNPISSIRE